MFVDSQQSPRVTASLTLRVGADADAAQIADAVVAAWQEIDAVLTSIVGPLGVAALYRRSLHLTGQTHPWLARANDGVPTPMDLATLKSLLVQQSSTSAAAGGGAFLRTFHDLLASLIGPSLTERLLRSVLENFLSGPPAQDISP